MSGATVDKVRVFQCPQCGEFINTSMSACQFCGAAVNADASAAAADVQDQVASACSTASYMKVMARAYPVFYLVSWIPLVGGVGALGSLVLFFAVPIMFLYWWVKFSKIETPDPDYKKAKSSTWVSLALWGAVVVIGLLISAILVVFKIAATQS